MEFPNVGEHCELDECRRLDFLPIKCSGCKKIFCSEHFLFDKHRCPCNDTTDQQSGHQDPICPLCNKPVPIKIGDSPDYCVSEHIDQNCTIKRDKVFKNRCTLDGCKRKELMPLLCERCQLNHCLLHRHPNDHQCEGSNSNSNVTRRHSASAAASRALSSFARRGKDGIGNIKSNISQSLRQASNHHHNPVSSAAAVRFRSSTVTETIDNHRMLQGNFTEEEALNIALQESLQQQSSQPPPPSSSSITNSRNVTSKDRTNSCQLS